MFLKNTVFFIAAALSCMLEGSHTQQVEEKSAFFDLETAVLISRADRDFFFQNGFVTLKGVFKAESDQLKERCSAMAMAILETLSENAYGESERNQVTYLRGAQVVFKKEVGQTPKIIRIVGCGSYDPFLLKSLRSYKIVEAFSFLLHAEVLEHLICQCHLKLPKDEVKFDKHKDIDNRKRFDPDWEDIGGDCSYAVGILAVDKMSEDNGGLILELDSHKGEGKGEIFAPVLEPGDFLLMHPYLTHWSECNHSEKSRMTLLTGFCIAGANHRNYPGNCTNTLISAGVDGFLTIENAPWKIEEDESFKVR